MRERVAEVISLRLKARDLIAKYSSSWDRRRRQRQYDQPPRIAFDNHISARYTVVDIEAQDKVGLLYRIAYLLDELDLSIHRAIINTVAARAQDSFYIVRCRRGEDHQPRGTRPDTAVLARRAGVLNQFTGENNVRAR